ncbi:hypothetical protein LXL04_036751 [Taraxacum kok-saghyz]
MRRFVRTEEEPATATSSIGSSVDLALLVVFPVSWAFQPVVVVRMVVEVETLRNHLLLTATHVRTRSHHRCSRLPLRTGCSLLIRVLEHGDELPTNILKKGEWTVCSIHTSKKQKKAQQIHKKEEESIDSD